MRKWLTRGLILFIVVALIFWLFFIPEKPVSVRVIAAEAGVVESLVTNSKAGSIRARRRAGLSPEVGGRVVKIAFKEGDWVKSGDVIVELEHSTQSARLELAEKSLRSARAAASSACITRDRSRRELERKRKLAEQDIMSHDVLDALQSAYESARANCNAAVAEVDKAKASIDLAQAELSKMVISAPFDGVIAELDVNLGEWITSAPPLLSVPASIDLIDPLSIYISAPMDEVDSTLLKVGQITKVTIDSYRGKQFPGKIARIAPYVLDVEAQNRTVEIEVNLDDREFSSSLLPGTSADVEVILDSRDVPLRIPTSVLLEGNRVLVVENKELVEKQLEIGLKNWDYAEVLSGLSANDQVVSSLDSEDIQAGARVVVEEASFNP